MSAVPMLRVFRSPLLVLVGACGLLLSLFAAGAAADPPQAATRIVVTSITTPSIEVPSTPGTPAVFVVRGVDFTVDVAFVADDGVTPLPLSQHHDTAVSLSVLTGPDAASGVARVDVPKGATVASFEGVQLATPASQVRLGVDAIGKTADDVAPAVSAPFEVLKSFQAAPSSSTLTSIGVGGGVGTNCEATADEPICADLLLPRSAGVLSTQLLSLGVCDASTQCPADRSVVQALVDLDPTVYTREAPATLVMKCDKSTCQGGGISSYTLTVSLLPTDPPVTAPACTVKGQVDPGLDFCVDYVQSTRANAGDTHLVLLFLQDARVRFP